MGGRSPRSAARRAAASLLSLACATAAVRAVPPRDAHAFCGFYVGGADKKLFNNATIVVLLRDGTRTVLSMQNNYQGPPENFAMVVPVPVVLQKENVKTLQREVFEHVDQLAAPRLVEYWEQDPCMNERLRYDAVPPPPGAVATATAAAAASPYGVKIEAKFTVGEYEIVILSAKDSGGLERWLKDSGYKIPEGAEPLLRPYVRDGSKFFVAKVDVSKVKMENGMAMLSPLRFHYDTDKFSLPVRLGLANSAGTQDLLVHILAPGKRYEVANYKNVTIPTNIDIDEKARDKFAAFYAALFDRTLEKNLDSDHRPPVVTEYSWDASSCDPCPGPPLDPSEIATLGADTMMAPSPAPEPSVAPTATPTTKGTRPCGCAAGDLMCAMKCASNSKTSSSARPSASSSPTTSATGWPSASAWQYGQVVITRLHARYTKDQLAEDLVFKEAPPISGGREVFQSGAAGEYRLENGATSSGINNFQGRYAIRHPWTGPVECANPRRGIWGGPPSSDVARGEAKVAQDLAFAPRGGVDLAALVRRDVPELAVVAKDPLPAFKPPAPSSGAPSGRPAGSGSPVSSASGAAPGSQSSGCGCRVPVSEDGAAGGGAFAALLGAAAGLFARRKRATRDRR